MSSDDQRGDDAERRRPPHHPPLPEPGGQDVPVSADAFAQVQASDEFAELKRRFRNFAFPLTAAFLVWYFLYVVLSIWAVDFMATPVIGNVSIGIILGLAQFVTTFLITWLYIRHATRNIDPIATELRERLEGVTR